MQNGTRKTGLFERRRGRGGRVSINLIHYKRSQERQEKLQFTFQKNLRGSPLEGGVGPVEFYVSKEFERVTFRRR